MRLRWQHQLGRRPPRSSQLIKPRQAIKHSANGQHDVTRHISRHAKGAQPQNRNTRIEQTSRAQHRNISGQHAPRCDQANRTIVNGSGALQKCAKIVQGEAVLETKCARHIVTKLAKNQTAAHPSVVKET